jgi:AraC-like DNA-binding protein
MALTLQRDNASSVIPISAQYEKLNGAVLRGLSRDVLLRESFIDPEQHDRISFAQAGLLYVNTMIEMDDQFIGFGRRSIPTSQLALLLRVMIGCSTLDGTLESLIQFHESAQPMAVKFETGELESKLSVNCDDSFAGANAPLIEDIYIQSIFGGLSYFLGRPFPASAVSTRNRNNPVIGARHYSMLLPLQLGTAAAIRFPTWLMAERRQAKPTDDIYWSVCENWLAVASGVRVRTSGSLASIRRLNTKALCSELGISPATFRRANSNEGRNFRRFREETLVEASLTLLADDSRNISSIAQELGYADVRSYRRFVKGATGLTPDQLRMRSDAATMRAFEPKVVARIKDLTTRLSL